jgi:hypothetical protein
MLSHNFGTSPNIEKESIHVSVLIGTRNRYSPLIRCLNTILSQNYPYFEIIILDDSSQEKIEYFVKAHFTDPRIKFLRSEKHLGVAGGRNILMQKAKGNIYLFIDDDAYFLENNSIEKIVNYFIQNTNVGILAFKVINYQNTHSELYIPFPKYYIKKRKNIAEYEKLVSYFLGTSHAIRNKVIENCGYYPENLVYGGEEMYLSYKAISKGFSILYIPDIIVHHYPKASTIEDKSAEKSESYYNIRNKIWFIYSYVPKKYFLSNIVISIIINGISSLKSNQLLDFFRGIKDGILKLGSLRHYSLDKNTLTYLKKNFGRLWY